MDTGSSSYKVFDSDNRHTETKNFLSYTNVINSFTILFMVVLGFSFCVVHIHK
jgi:hypothetical protein